MKQLCFAVAFLLFTTTNGFAQIEDPALNALFSDAYERPYIDWCRDQLPNLQVCSVFDYANLVEDPLIPDCWLVTNGSAKHRCGQIETMRDALAAVAYVPSSANEALAVARLWAAAQDHTILMAVDLPHHGGIPPEVVSRITDPTVTEADGVFTVDFYTFDFDEAAAFFGEEVRETIDHLTLRVGPEVFDLQRERLVSSRHSEEVHAP